MPVQSRGLLRLLAVVVLLLAGPAAAERPSAAAVERLLVLSRTEQTMDALFPMMDKMIASTLDDMLPAPLPPEQQAEVSAVMDMVMKLARDELSWSKLKPQFIELYRDTFSQEEIDGLLAFFGSPVGQSYLAKVPMLMEGSMVITQRSMQTVMPKIKAVLTEATKKSVKQPRSAPAATSP